MACWGCMIWSHFVRDNFEEFMKWMAAAGCGGLGVASAWNIIQHDVKNNFPLSDSKNRAIILVVDELIKSGHPDMLLAGLSQFMYKAKEDP